MLFYRAADGLRVMVDLEPLGQVSICYHTFQTLTPGYTHVVAAGEDILFYNALTEVLAADPWVSSVRVGSLVIEGGGVWRCAR